MSQCKLCNQIAPLKLSHMFPRFISRWLKDTGTGFLRSVENLNSRIQDSTKCYMLCVDCEERFSKLETYVSGNIFYPIVENKVSGFQYDEKLFKFVISIFWRLLHHSMLDDPKRTEILHKIVLRAEEKWRNYLLEIKELDEFDRLHLLVGVDVIGNQSNVDIEISKRLSHYMARYIDAGITDDGVNCCVGFVKLPRFFFLIPLAGFSEEQLFNTEILKEGGFYVANNARVENPDWSYLLIERVKQLDKAWNSMSPVQRQKMQQAGVGSWNRYKDRDLGDILRYQYKKINT